MMCNKIYLSYSCIVGRNLEIDEVKHYYQEGVTSRKGIES